MKKNITFFIILLSSITLVSAQSNELIGQYYLTMPAYNPAHTGADDFLNITAGFRQQWTGFTGAPHNIFLSAYGAIRRNSHSDSSYLTTPKHGIGGYVMDNQQGAFKQNEVALMYAYHVPMARGIFLSLGMSPSLYKEKVDVVNITVEDPISDPVYQSLLLQGNSFSKFQLNTGLSLYSQQFYISYSLRELSKAGISGNGEAFSNKTDRRHHLMAGYTFHINEKFDLMPNTFIRIAASRPTLLEFGARLRHNQNSWLALSYRNDKTMVGGLGFIAKNKFQFGYAFEYKSFGISQYSRGTHEIIVGMHLFKNKPTITRVPSINKNVNEPIAVVTPDPMPKTEVKPVEQVKPMPVVLMPVVQSTNGETFATADLYVKNLTTGEEKKYNDLYSLGIELVPQHTYEIIASKEGYLTETISVSPSKMAQPNNEIPLTIVLKKTGPFKNFSVGELIELNIKYDVGKADVRSESIPELTVLIELLKDNPTLQLEIGAHTDARGSSEANMLLSQRRAEAVVNYLLSKGIERGRLSAKGYGESKLKMPNAQSEQEHAQNRRTSIVITGK